MAAVTSACRGHWIDADEDRPLTAHNMHRRTSIGLEDHQSLTDAVAGLSPSVAKQGPEREAPTSTMKEPPMKSPFSEPTPPTELTVVGENKQDPSQLLVMGVDGSYYAYSLTDGDARVVEPDDRWNIEPVSSQDLFA